MGTKQVTTGTTTQGTQLTPQMQAYMNKLATTATGQLPGPVQRLGEVGRYDPVKKNVAALTGPQTEGLDTTAQRARDGNPLLQPSLDYATKAASGGFLTSNPFIDDIVRQEGNRIANQQAGRWASMGRFGSPSQAKYTAEGIASATLPILAQNYEAERGRQAEAIGMLPMLSEARYYDPTKLTAVGDVYQQQAQAAADAAYAQAQGAQEQRFQQDTALANLLLGLGTQADTGATKTVRETQPYNPVSNVLGGILGFGSLLL